MAAYATVADVQARMTHAMTEQEQTICATLLEDAGVLIDTAAPQASQDAAKVVSCRMVQRAMGDLDGGNQVPMGATQGSMSKLEKQLLGTGNRIGSHSPVEDKSGARSCT